MGDWVVRTYREAGITHLPGSQNLIAARANFKSFVCETNGCRAKAAAANRETVDAWTPGVVRVCCSIVQIGRFAVHRSIWWEYDVLQIKCRNRNDLEAGGLVAPSICYDPGAQDLSARAVALSKVSELVVNHSCVWAAICYPYITRVGNFSGFAASCSPSTQLWLERRPPVRISRSPGLIGNFLVSGL